jgi:superfamily II DNA or RNA helicase
MCDRLLFAKPGSPNQFSLLREFEEWGLKSVDIVGPPRRFCTEQELQESVVEEGLDARRLNRIALPAELLSELPPGDNWQSMSRRSIARLQVYFLVIEDPQRRLDRREVETLSHQVSLVRHILESKHLNRVLIADEVGLGKTIEAGLLLKELLIQTPELRILYLAPARLVSNVRREFERLKLPFRQWSAYDGDARLTDPKIIASMHRAVFGDNFDRITNTAPWDILIVDECHHISAYSPDGTDARQAYKLVEGLINKQPCDARVILMSGTPHQGHGPRFENLLRLLNSSDPSSADLAGRVIYRTKDDILDWDGNPVFPNRQVNEPIVVDLGPSHRNWLKEIYRFYCPPRGDLEMGQARRRAAGWRCAQAMQWATSSPHAGLGYLVRQAIRAGWKGNELILKEALELLRPYRMGPEDESVSDLYRRISNEVGRQEQNSDVDDIEVYVPGRTSEPESRLGLECLLRQGIALVRQAGDEKWRLIQNILLKPAGDEKVVLFAQPIETVTSLARFLEKATGERPALIIGGQSDADRSKEVEAFWRPEGPRYLVSSKAGGEGINLQVARRLIHIDVPWNPMDMEQRVGRIHRFGSRETVIVDTVVVKDSREWDAYEVAREKLALIVQTLVEKERFESVYSRVMCLMPQEEYAGIMVNGFGAPLSGADRDKLAEMVQQGFQRWKEFHDKYGQNQNATQQQDRGLADWSDISYFLEQMTNAKRLDGFKRQRFAREGNRVKPVEDEAAVLRLNDGRAYVCADYGEFLVYGANGEVTPRLGLNTEVVKESLRRFAYGTQPAGAAYVRWPVGEPRPVEVSTMPFGVLVFARQTVQLERTGVWVERRSSLRAFVTTANGTTELLGKSKGSMLRGIFRSVIRKSPDPEAIELSRLRDFETELSQQLRRPSEDELDAKIRHAVTPLFAGVITD